MKKETKQKFLTISLVGAPNAGKSTLLNKVIGQKLSIVTPKPQTTRKNIRGIANISDTQLVFLDTPGIFTPNKTLERKIVRQAVQGFKESGYICFLFDAKKSINEGISEEVKRLFLNLEKEGRKSVAIINKVDLIKDKKKLLLVASELSELHKFEKIFMISATKGLGVEDVLEFFIRQAPEEKWMFDDGAMTDTTERSIAEEITREKIFMAVDHELPYAIDVHTERWEEGADGSAKVYQIIYILKPSQKPIILGAKGEKLKEIGRRSRIDISKSLGRTIHLFLYVKVKGDWIEKLSLSK